MMFPCYLECIVSCVLVEQSQRLFFDEIWFTKY